MFRWTSPPDSGRLDSEFLRDLTGVLISRSGSAKDTLGPLSPSVILVSGTSLLENRAKEELREKFGLSRRGAVGPSAPANMIFGPEPSSSLETLVSGTSMLENLDAGFDDDTEGCGRSAILRLAIREDWASDLLADLLEGRSGLSDLADGVPP